MMKKWLWLCIALTAAGCSDDENQTGRQTGGNPLSTLTADVDMGSLSAARLVFLKQNADRDLYELTLSTDAATPAAEGGSTGAFVRFRLAVAADASPFGRYAIGEGDERVIADGEDGSMYYALENGTVTAQAPLCGGQLTLSKVPGKKPTDTRYCASFTARDDAKKPHTVSGTYEGLPILAEKPGTTPPQTTYTLAGVSGYTPETEYTTWGIDFDNADFTRHLAVFSLNAGPGIAEADGIPSGIYTIAEDDAPFTATWVAYDDSAQDISMQDLVEGTITIDRDGGRYKVKIDAIDYDDVPFRADFEGPFYYENASAERTLDTREAYAVYYGPVSDGTSWYITLADRGYLTTGDAVGNYYYGSILRLDLVAAGTAAFTDGLPEGTFRVLGVRSGAGIYGGTGNDCTSFLTEYFSGIPTVCKLTGGEVRIARNGEQVSIAFDGLEMSGDITSLEGTYTGKVQYIDGRE